MCKSAPRAASALCSPSRQAVATPTVIKPICDTDEQASVRLRLTLNSASSAPRNIVTTPRNSSMLPQAASAKKRFIVTAIMPNTPVFVRIPESSALAGAGATGCALGSQMCIGNMPAFAPKPTSSSAPAA